MSLCACMPVKDNRRRLVCVCVCVCVCAYVFVCPCVYVCVCVRFRVCVCVHVSYASKHNQTRVLKVKLPHKALAVSAWVSGCAYECLCMSECVHG